MQAVDQPLLDASLAELKSKPGRTKERVAHMLSYPILLDRYGPYLTLGSFSCRPWRGRSQTQVAGFSRKPIAVENRTPRIPEPVIGALLRWSLKYIDLFASDIFAARDDLESLRRARSDKPLLGGALTDKLDLYIGRRCATGRGIPIRLANRGGHSQPPPQERINFDLIALQLGGKTAHLLEPVRRQRLDRAFSLLDGEVGGMDTRVTIDPDTGQPWRERFDQDSIAREERMLQAAAYVVCAASPDPSTMDTACRTWTPVHCGDSQRGPDGPRYATGDSLAEPACRLDQRSPGRTLMAPGISGQFQRGDWV